MPLGWAIVSTGRHPDQKMAPAINAAGARIAAVVSRTRERAQEFADKHGAAAAYDDYDAMLIDPAVDVVYLASPNHLHAEQTLKAAAAGKHVLCEKPMALSLDECQAMIDACERAGVRLGIGFHLRHHPGHQRLRSLISEGALGTLSLSEVSWVRGVRGEVAPPPRPPSQEWWEDPLKAGAGVMMATGVHCVDLLRFLTGREITAVTALNDAHAASPLEQLLAMLLRFEDGSVGVVKTSRRTPDYPHNDVAVYGSLGRCAVTGSVDTILQGELTIACASLGMTQRFRPPDPLAMYTNQVAEFEEAVENGDAPLASGQDGLRAAQITIAMRQSASDGRAVEVG